MSFESQIEKIDVALSQHSHTWTLKARPDISYDDVEQIIRIHIYKKWNQWDQNLPLEPWIHRIISNQLINILRNLYTNKARPCLRCPANLGDDLCKLYTKQCSNCPLFAKWEVTKKRAFNVQLPLPIENHTQEVNNQPHQNLDYDKSIPKLNQRLKVYLKPIEWRVYSLCYIENKSDKEVAEIMDFKYEKSHKRYKRISQLKEIIRDKAQEVIKIYGVE